MRLLASLTLIALTAPACSGGGGDGPSAANGQDAAAAAGKAVVAEDEQEAPTGAAPAAAASEGDPALTAIHEFIAGLDINKGLAGWKTRVTRPPQVSFDENSDYFWNMETNKGLIKIKFLPDVAPMHVSSTIYLTELGFYDDVKFHRVIQGFMAQGGDPQGTGRGGPAYKYNGEFDPKTRHNRPGLLSMANAGPGTDGSQFFLTFVPTPHLDGKHTIFGEVSDGMAVVKKLEAAGSRSGATKEPLSIVKATISVEAKTDSN